MEKISDLKRRTSWIDRKKLKVKTIKIEWEQSSWFIILWMYEADFNWKMKWNHTKLLFSAKNLIFLFRNHMNEVEIFQNLPSQIICFYPQLIWEFEMRVQH